jgi:hypothetical protein
MGRKSNLKAQRRALRPPPDIAETVARIEARIEKMDVLCPGWGSYLDGMLRDIPRDWPEWCLVPMGGAAAIAEHIGDHAEPTAAAEMTALFTWSKGRSIYRFDADLAASVLATPVTDEIPTDLFYRLPEWGIYIEAPPNGLWPAELLGVFVHLESDSMSGQPELRLFGDPSDASTVIVIPLHLSETSIKEMLSAAIRTAATMARSYNMNLDIHELTDVFSEGQIDQMSAWLAPIVSCIMYLCTNDADIVEADPVNHRGKTQSVPARARQKDIGFRIGAALRSSRTRPHDGQHESTGRHVAPHLRRAHWHRFWTGSLKDPSQRELIVKWIPPIPVNLEQGEMQTVVRYVR